MSLILAIIAALAAAGTIACLSWQAVQSWLRGRAATEADLVRTHLANGDVQIVAIGLNPAGVETARKTWTAKSLDPALAGQFGSADRIRIYT